MISKLSTIIFAFGVCAHGELRVNLQAVYQNSWHQMHIANTYALSPLVADGVREAKLTHKAFSSLEAQVFTISYANIMTL